MHKKSASVKLAICAAGLVLGAICPSAYAEGTPVKPESSALSTRADMQASRKQFKEAEISYQKALSADPLNTDAINGLIALYRQQGMAAKVQLMIAQLTPAQRNALGPSLKRIESTMLQEQAELRLSKGQEDQSIKYLEQAIQVDADDPWLHFKLANQYARRGEITKGRTLLEDFQAAHPDNVEALYILALYQSDRGDTGNALQTMNRIEAAKRNPDMAALQQRLTIKNLGPNARLLMQSGKKREAIKMLSETETASAGNADQMLAVAFAWADIGEINRGRELYDKVQAGQSTPLKFDILDRNAWGGLIKILDASGDRDQALQQLNAWSAGNKTNDIPVGLHLGNLYADLGEYDRAQQQIDILLAAHPDATYVLYDAWKMAQRSGRTDREIDYLRKLVIAEPAIRADSSPDTGAPQAPLAQDYANIGIGDFGSADRIQRDWKEKKLASLIDRRARWFSSAIDVRNRTGTAGLSEFHSVEIPLEYKTPWNMNDEIFFRADLIKLSAGTVDSTNSDFGGMLLCPLTCASAPFTQDAQGVSFTVGYQRKDFVVDIGTTPRSFPVANIVGGIQSKGDLGQWGYSLEVSQRPVTASLLSYSGTRDPYSGETWGGVVATGGRLGLSLDKGGTFGFWSSLGLHNLTGRNVQSNRRLQLMAGEQLRVINGENRRLVVGLTGMYWDFSENAGEYTFGHGGYYSPHNYRSLSLPITYAARSPRFSYMLRAAVSASRSQTRDALFYPTNSAMQDQATTILAPALAAYSSGASGGRGYSLRAVWEYQAATRLFIGGLFAMDRSDYYAPNQVLFYIRYSLDQPGAQPVFLPPEPVEPSSQFY